MEQILLLTPTDHAHQHGLLAMVYPQRPPTITQAGVVTPDNVLHLRVHGDGCVHTHATRRGGDKEIGNESGTQKV